MRVLRVATVVVTGLTLTAGGVMLAARGQQSRPGEIGENHVLVDNRSSNQAVPVIVQPNLDPSKALGVRAVRQSWEYRTLAVAPGKDRLRSLVALLPRDFAARFEETVVLERLASVRDEDLPAADWRAPPFGRLIKIVALEAQAAAGNPTAVAAFRDDLATRVRPVLHEMMETALSWAK